MLSQDAKVVAVCISEKKGTTKHPVDAITLKVERGIIGDAFGGIIIDKSYS